MSSIRGQSDLSDSTLNVDVLSDGFHSVSREGGNVSLYCSRCNVPAKA